MHVRQAGVTEGLEPSGASDGDNARLKHLAEMADALVEKLGAVGDQYEQLKRTLEEPTLPGAGADGTAVRDTAARAYEPLGHSADPGGGEAYGPPVHESVRLVVMDMAIKGSTRDQTKAYVRDVFGLEGGDPIVDEIYDHTDAAQDSHRWRPFSRRA